jgi:rhodanese-related sulfurtransferase
LFLGDVGRPDLAQKAADMTQEQLAGLLYDSLMTKIMPLADDITVYPAHGAGSACGKNMMKETVDSLGNQKKMNYALNQPNKEAFIEAVTDGLLAPPPYFGFNVAMNKMGYDNFEKVKERAMNPLSPSAFEAIANATNALILDTRNSDLFKDGFIPQSINIGIKGDFAPWVGALIGDVKQEILLVTDPGIEEEVITRLSRVGFDHVLGYLAGGFDAWNSDGKPVDTISRISAVEFEQQFELGTSTVIDVRKETEYAAEHIEDAYLRPLASINDWINNLDGNHFFLHCAGGYRSMIAASILQARGIRNFTEIAGGYNAITQTNMPTTDFICQSKVL